MLSQTGPTRYNRVHCTSAIGSLALWLWCLLFKIIDKPGADVAICVDAPSHNVGALYQIYQAEPTYISIAKMPLSLCAVLIGRCCQNPIQKTIILQHDLISESGQAKDQRSMLAPTFVVTGAFYSSTPTLIFKVDTMSVTLWRWLWHGVPGTYRDRHFTWPWKCSNLPANKSLWQLIDSSLLMLVLLHNQLQSRCREFRSNYIMHGGSFLGACQNINDYGTVTDRGRH